MTIINALGRRKASVARVYLSKGKGDITVNGKDYKSYFTIPHLSTKVEDPFKAVDSVKEFDVTVNVYGGGIKGQADAIKLGIARALVKFNEEYRALMKPTKLLTRDSRVVERKKPGLRKARKRDQFSKR